MSFDYLNVFKPNEQTEDYHIRQPNVENFLFEIGDKKHIFVGEKVITFETNDIIVKHYSKLGFNDVKYPYAYSKENIYLMVHRKYISIEEYKNSTQKDEYENLYRKDDKLKGDNIADENEGVVEYGNDFKNCKIIHARD